ncbi:hypothetical protein ACTHT3_19040, partial [Neisseria sp. P0015.S004]
IQLPPLPQKPNKGRDNPKSRNLLFKINDQFIQNQYLHFYNTLSVYTSITLFCCFYTNNPQLDRLKTIT